MKQKIYKYSLFILIVSILLINFNNILLYTRLYGVETFNSSIDNSENKIISSLNYFDNNKDINIESIIKRENSICYKIKLKGKERIHEISRILKMNTSLEILKLKAFRNKDGEIELTFDIIEK